MHESAHDEQRDAEEQRQPHLLSRKIDDSRHDKSAEDGKQRHIPESLVEPTIHDFVCSIGQFWYCTLDGERHKCAANDVAQYDDRQLNPVSLGLHKSASASVKFHSIAPDCNESKGKT